MQSEQEYIIKNFIQDSFGSQNLFIPFKTVKNREPADLFWHNNGFLILFYMQKSRGSVDKQIEHNLRQADGFYRHWKNGLSMHALRGKNRFGDHCSVFYHGTTYLINLSVVSVKMGILFHKCVKNKNLTELTLTIPDELIHLISSIGGTIIDLLNIIYKYSVSQTRLGRHNNFMGYQRLISIWKSHLIETYDIPANQKKLISGIHNEDILFVNNIISSMRVPSTENFIESTKGRELTSRIFTDMSAKDFFYLSTSAALAIQMTASSMHKKSYIIKTIGLYYNFVIAALCTLSSNFLEGFNHAIEISKDPDGNIKNIIIIYGHTREGLDYRSPVGFTFPNLIMYFPQ